LSDEKSYLLTREQRQALPQQLTGVLVIILVAGDNTELSKRDSYTLFIVDLAPDRQASLC